MANWDDKSYIQYGDVFNVEGREFRASEQNGVVEFEAITPTCVACGENDVEESGSCCPGCVTRAMEAIAIHRGIEKLLDGDDTIVGVMDWDNAQARDAHALSEQYIDIHSSAHDYMASLNDEVRKGILTAWISSIMASWHTLYGSYTPYDIAQHNAHNDAHTEHNDTA